MLQGNISMLTLQVLGNQETNIKSFQINLIYCKLLHINSYISSFGKNIIFKWLLNSD